jgi:hypothetical protein
MERKFSFMYSELVSSPEDMVGHIAYSLYKSNKIKFIEQFKAENGDKTPEESDLEAFHKATKSLAPALRIQAEQILTSFTELMLQDAIGEIEKNQENVLRQIIQPIIPKEKSPWDGFWMAVIVKGAQTVVVAAIIFLIIFLSSAKDDFWGTIHKNLPPGKHQGSSQNAPIENH